MVLLDVQTRESALLRQLDIFGNLLISNQVNGDFLTWEHCRTGNVGFFACEIVLYEISSGTKAPIPNPGKQQYASSVSRDGSIYFTRGGQSKAWRCGTT